MAAAPLNVQVVSYGPHETETGQRFIAYTLSVQWDETTHWTVTHRYVHFRNLKDALAREFPHLSDIKPKDLGKIHPMTVLWVRLM